MLGRIQNDLFDLGADLCTPEDCRRAAGALRITAPQVERLEREIDAMNAGLRPLDSFILPGGTAVAAYLHLARTITRRAERLVSNLAAGEPVNPEALKYLNRLSDHLFVLGRRVNDGGARDILWRPGANRPDKYDRPGAPPREGRDSLGLYVNRMEQLGQKVDFAPLSEVADICFDGIVNDTFWITVPNPDQQAKIRARAESQVTQSPPDYLLEANLMTGSKAGSD